MKIFAALKSDHREIKSLLKKLDDTTEKGTKRRKELLNQLKEILVPHARAEEKVLYDPMKESDVEEADALAFEGYEEHGVVDRLMHLLESTPRNDKKWTAMMAVVKEALEHHIEEEENDIFKKAKKSFDADEEHKMGEQFLKLKKDFLKRLKRGNPPKQSPSHELV